eukprot:SAG31_NODE_983_length_10554_cov_6.049259_6_plen_254_part_00
MPSLWRARGTRRRRRAGRRPRATLRLCKLMAMNPAAAHRRLRHIGRQIKDPPSAAAPANAGSTRLKIAFVGCGQICHAHLNAANAISATKIHVAVCIDAVDGRAEEVALVVGRSAVGHGEKPKTFKSLAGAVEAGADFDAVVVMLPHHLHKPVALEAFAAGKHVLLEKPMAPTLEVAQDILSAASRTKSMCAVTGHRINAMQVPAPTTHHIDCNPFQIVSLIVPVTRALLKRRVRLCLHSVLDGLHRVGSGAA